MAAAFRRNLRRCLRCRLTRFEHEGPGHPLLPPSSASPKASPPMRNSSVIGFGLREAVDAARLVDREIAGAGNHAPALHGMAAQVAGRNVEVDRVDHPDTGIGLGDRTGDAGHRPGATNHRHGYPEDSPDSLAHRPDRPNPVNAGVTRRYRSRLLETLERSMRHWRLLILILSIGLALAGCASAPRCRVRPR